MLALLRRTVIATAWAYPVALVAVIFAFKWLGEDWWLTASTLYLPRFGFGLPLLVLLPALLLFRAYRALWSQALAALLVLLPLMGLSVPSSWPSGGRAPLRVLSLNANSGYFGAANIVAAIVQHDPDLVLLQEVFGQRDELEAELRQHYPNVQTSTQFMVASRFPILETTDPSKLQVNGKERSPRFMRYVLKTPLGAITAFSIHPASPRAGLNEIRGPQGFRHELLSGHALSSHAAPGVEKITELRRTQVEAVIRDAADERNPVIIAGDTNLPTLSKIASTNFAAYQDGFAKVGLGFGYTYPARLKWMRIDRVLASSSLAFKHFEVSCPGISDHLCVVADLALR